MELGGFLVDKESVRHPDEVDVVRTNHQLTHPATAHVKPQTVVSPELPAYYLSALGRPYQYHLPEVHVEGEVHELVADFTHVENVERDSHRDWGTTIVRSDTSVVTNLPKVSVYKEEKLWKTLYLKVLQQCRDVKNF